MYKRTIRIKRQITSVRSYAYKKKKRKQQFWKWYEEHFICFENMAGVMMAVTLVTRQESRRDSYRKWILQFNCKLNVRNVSSERLAQIHARFHSDNTAVSRWTEQIPFWIHATLHKYPHFFFESQCWAYYSHVNAIDSLQSIVEFAGNILRIMKAAAAAAAVQSWAVDFRATHLCKNKKKYHRHLIHRSAN